MIFGLVDVVCGLLLLVVGRPPSLAALMEVGGGLGVLVLPLVVKVVKIDVGNDDCVTCCVVGAAVTVGVSATARNS